MKDKYKTKRQLIEELAVLRERLDRGELASDEGHTRLQVGELKQAEETLRDVAHGVSAATGDEFFRSLVNHLGKTLHADYAFVGALTGEDNSKATTIAVYAHGTIVDNFEYPLANTPCEDVMSKEFCCYARGVRQRFPHDQLLAKLAVESYVGIPLIGSGGGVLGLIAVLDSRPVSNTKLAESTLRIFAARASVELERTRTEEALRESEKRFRNYFELQSIGIAITSAAKRWIEVNDKLCELFGYSREELLQILWTELTHPDDLPDNLVLFDRAVAGEIDEYVLDKRFIRKDGSVLYANVSARCVRDSDGQVDYFLTVYQDITERKQTEEALRESEERYRTVAEDMPALVCRFLPDGVLTFVNEQYCRYFNKTRQELIGYNFLQFIPEEERNKVREHYASLTPEEPVTTYEHKVMLPDGTLRWQQWTDRALFDEEGRAIEYQSIGQDVTEHKHAEQALRESEERFRNLIEGSIQGILIDRRRKPVFVNQSFADMLGYASSDEILAMESVDPCVAPHERERLRRYTEARLRGEMAPEQYEYDAIRKDGSIVTLENVVRLISWKGRPAIQSTVIDITQRKRAEKALEASERRYRALYDDNPCMYFTIDPRGSVLSVNPFGAKQLGYSEEELIGTSFFDLADRYDKSSLAQCLDRVICEPHNLHRWEARKRRKDSSLLWARETARVIQDADGQQVILIVCEDITDAHRLSEELSYQASHDSLTGLVNRREFESRLERVLQNPGATSSEHALCYLDLDQFKVINDICGHIAGDELLRQLGQVLAGKVRKRDTLARLGGDEFGVLMEHCSLEQGERVAQAVQQAIEDFRFVWEGRIFGIGVSIGLVPIGGTSETVANVLSMADTACYAAKEAGRNRVHVYHEADIDLARRHGEMRLASQINQALEEHRFRLASQPIVSLAENHDEREHYELLIRMEDANGGMIPPGAFLPAAERYNLSAKLDRWAVETAFEWLNNCPRRLERLYLCSINLSGHSLADKEFLRFVNSQFDKADIPPDKICFEITETAAIANLESANGFIQALRTRGCYFALDNFGSGLSSFAYLKNLAVDFIKIDGLFVKDIIDDPIAFAMVNSINEIGHVMGKRTIAQFVENGTILERLREVGVDYAQGYGIGRPQLLTRARSRIANMTR